MRCSGIWYLGILNLFWEGYGSRENKFLIIRSGQIKRPSKKKLQERVTLKIYDRELSDVSMARVEKGVSHCTKKSQHCKFVLRFYLFKRKLTDNFYWDFLRIFFTRSNTFTENTKEIFWIVFSWKNKRNWEFWKHCNADQL